MKISISFLVVCLIVAFSTQSDARQRWYETYGVANKYDLTTPSSVPKMINALSDENANVRKSAAGILKKIGPQAKAAVPDLLRVMTADSNANVRKAALVAIYNIRYRGIDYLTALKKMGDEDPHSRLRAYAAKLSHKLQIEVDRFKPTKESTPHIETPSVKKTTPPNRTALSPPEKKSASSKYFLQLPKAEKLNRYAIAVIIGNKNYSNPSQEVPDVDFAHNDADAMKRYVTESLGYREGNVILLKDATQADLVSTFGTEENHKGKLYDWIRPGESEIFVFYSGHGAPGLKDGRGYILPVDANPLKVELNGYPLDTLYSNIGKLPVKDVTVVIDACFSGSSASGSLVKNSSAIGLIQKRSRPEESVPKATVITAAGVSEIASWDESAKLGLLTRHFLEGVTGTADSEDFGNKDGKVTLSELKKFLGEEVTYSARRLYGRDQTPSINGDPEKVFFVEK